VSAEFVPAMSETFHIYQIPSTESDLQLLLDVLPERIQKMLKTQDLNHLVEVVMDLGRIPEARFSSGDIAELSSQQITLDEINHVVKRVGFFTTDNRAGIPRTLHRISAMRNRQGEIIGLTCRVGKVVTGTIEAIEDLVESGKSVLLLGRPGVGKTTKLREIAKLLADKSRKRVVVVDTSNEIAGDGDIPHPAVGRARRMQVSSHDRQKEVMIEAVQNHTPEVIVVDEIGTEEEALAARTIAERGVVLIATAHGNSLDNLIKNPTLSDLIGGVETVTLGDEEAKRRATQKTVLERAKKPTFDIAIEIRDQNTLAIYPDVSEAVDHILRGWTIFPEVRKIDYTTGSIKVFQSDVEPIPLSISQEEFQAEFQEDRKQGIEPQNFKLYIYGISKIFADRILERLDLKDIGITRQVTEADAIIALRSSCRPGSKMMRVAEDYEIPIYFAKTNTMPQIQRSIREALNSDAGSFMEQMVEMPAQDEMEIALQEAREAIEVALNRDQPIELAPRRSYIRRLQHELVEKHKLMSFSVGDEPNRRLKVLPPPKPKPNHEE
jgi:stage III sporulation protein SpoIIIAA